MTGQFSFDRFEGEGQVEQFAGNCSAPKSPFILDGSGLTAIIAQAGLRPGQRGQHIRRGNRVGEGTEIKIHIVKNAAVAAAHAVELRIVGSEIRFEIVVQKLFVFRGGAAAAVGVEVVGNLRTAEEEIAAILQIGLHLRLLGRAESLATHRLIPEDPEYRIVIA